MPNERVSFTWSTKRVGNDGYVLESAGNRYHNEFGPMPPHVVPAFVQARRRFIAMLMERYGAAYVLETLPDNPAQETRHEHDTRFGSSKSN